MKAMRGISQSVSKANLPDMFRPQLTSIVDVMTFLLFFLIKSFSVEGTVVTPSSDLELPISSSPKTPKLTTTIEITKKEIVSDGKVLANIAQVQKRNDLLIPQLYSWMQLELSKGKSNTNAREVLIQSDKSVEYEIIKKVMYTCSKAGYVDFSILTIKEE